jgi:hypothetical protein
MQIARVARARGRSPVGGSGLAQGEETRCTEILNPGSSYGKREESLLGEGRNQGDSKF